MDQEQLARIRLLSSRFHELQGLRVALAGIAISTVLGSYLTTTQPTYGGAMIALAIAFALMAPGQWGLHRYYTRTVGRQVRTVKHSAWTVGGWSAYCAIAAFLNGRYPEIPPGAPTFAIVIVASLVVAIRDWPFRVHYFALAVAIATALGVTMSNTAEVDRGLRLAWTFFVTGVAFVPVGLLDHRLLMKLMQEARQPALAAPEPNGFD